MDIGEIIERIIRFVWYSILKQAVRSIHAVFGYQHFLFLELLLQFLQFISPGVQEVLEDYLDERAQFYIIEQAIEEHFDRIHEDFELSDENNTDEDEDLRVFHDEFELEDLD